MPIYSTRIKITAFFTMEVEATTKDEAFRLINDYDEAGLMDQVLEQGGEIDVKVLDIEKVVAE